MAHIQAALPRYDWILYGDLDFIVKDLSRPLQSFLHQFDLYGKEEVHVLVPADYHWGNNPMAFSTFAVFIKNSPFGRKLLENWRAFAMGICPNGNFAHKEGVEAYDWKHSDQPGLWYALQKTHMDFFPNNVHHNASIVTCNKTSGFIDDSKTGPYLDLESYFRKNKYLAGNHGEMLAQVPDNQAIIFSRTRDDSMSGLGDNLGFVKREDVNHSFALHWKDTSEQWFPTMRQELELCKRVHGCHARLDVTGEVKSGCNSTQH